MAEGVARTSEAKRDAKPNGSVLSRDTKAVVTKKRRTAMLLGAWLASDS
jgi:hypothetical protein